MSGRGMRISPDVVVVAGILVVATVLWALFLRGSGQPHEGPPGGSVPTSRPGTGSVGIQLDVVPDGEGGLRAVERVIAPRPVTRLRLTAPPPPEDSGAARVELVDLRVTADGEPVPAGWPGSFRSQVVELARPVTRLELRYGIVGASGRSPQAPAGRVTLSLRPAAYQSFRSAPAVIRVRGAVVHNLVCLGVPPADQLCGVSDGAGWRTLPVAAYTARVIALIDLPPSPA